MSRVTSCQAGYRNAFGHERVASDVIFMVRQGRNRLYLNSETAFGDSVFGSVCS